MNRICTKCLVEKTLDEYRIYKGKVREGTKNYQRNICIVCERNVALQYYYRLGLEGPKKTAKYRANLKDTLGVDEYNKKFSEVSKRWQKQNLEKVMLSKIRKRAKELDLDFNLELIDIIIPNICPILGIPLISRPKRNNYRFFSNYR